MNKYIVTLFKRSNPRLQVEEEYEAETKEQAEEMAYHAHLTDGWSVYELEEHREGLTAAQIGGVKCRIDYVLGYLFTDSFERAAIIEKIIDPVIKDIEETAGWQELGEDDYCDADTDIAMARVLYGIIVGE